MDAVASSCKIQSERDQLCFFFFFFFFFFHSVDLVAVEKIRKQLLI
jgi:hypothetical protein